MSANKTRFLLVTLLALVGILAMKGQSPVSAALVPASDGGASVASLSASFQVTATATLTATKTLTPTVVAATATKTLTPTVAAATATKTLTPTVAAATATKMLTPTVVVATATKTLTPTVAAATATKTATRAPATATKTATPAPTKTATAAARLGPRAGTVSSLSTLYWVQNLDQAITATVTAQYMDPLGNSVALGVTKIVPPRGLAVVDQRNSNGGLSGFSSWNGAVVLSSNTQIASIVGEMSPSQATLGQDFRSDMYNGVSSTSAAQRILLPQVLRGVYDASTAKFMNSTLSIQNTSLSASAAVTVTYYNYDHSTYVHNIASIPAGSALIVDLTTETTTPALPTLFNGSAVVTANQNIAVVVNQNAPGLLWSYTGFTDADASTKLYLPALMKNQMDASQGYAWGTLLLVMASDPTVSGVQAYVSYKNYDGWTTAQNRALNPNALFDQRSNGSLTSLYPPTGILSASGIVTSTVPVVALVSEFTIPDVSRGVRALSYRGFADGAGLTNSVFFPILARSQGDSGTGVTWHTVVLGQVITTSLSPVRVYLNYTNYDGQTAQSYRDVNPAVTTKFLFDQGAGIPAVNPAINPVLYASGVMTSTVPVVGTVMEVGNSTDMGDSAMGYMGINQ